VSTLYWRILTIALKQRAKINAEVSRELSYIFVFPK
jgi:hypothetical protein